MTEKKFAKLLADVRRLIVGLELTKEQGEKLIEEVRIRMRQPQNITLFDYRDGSVTINGKRYSAEEYNALNAEVRDYFSGSSTV